MNADARIAATEVLNGQRRAVARALARVEGRFERDELDALWQAVATRDEAAGTSIKGLTLGLTGPPGVGKSTLAGRIISAWRVRGLTVGVLCVDPSSRLSGGALLGDRVRMQLGDPDDGVFIRSLAARGRLGGLAPAIREATLIMQAAFDRVLIETVGVGQSETDITALADITAVIVQPASGDALQFLKAGLMEVYDVVVVNKSDLGPIAERALSDLRTALRIQGRRDTPVLAVSAATGRGIEAFVDAAEAVTTTTTTSILARRIHSYRAERIRESIAWYGGKALVQRGGRQRLTTSLMAMPPHSPPSAIEDALRAWFGDVHES